MFRVLTCLATQHDFRLVLLAALICAGASFTSFSIYSRALEGRDLKRWGWLFLTGVCTASGIWATHFVAMLAYDAGLPVAYDPVLTAASLLLAVPATTLGFFLCTKEGRLPVAAGGAVIGAGIGLMHFTGMHALVVPGTIKWDVPLVVISLMCGAGLAAGATLAFHRLSGARSMCTAAGLLTLAICALHFTAMGAAIVVPDPTVVVHASFIDSPTMALVIAALTVLVMLAGLAAALIDRQTSHEAMEQVRELVDATIEGIVVAKDGIVLNVNRRICELCGLSLEKLAGKRVFGDLLDESLTLPEIAGVYSAEGRLKAATGETVPVEVVCRPLSSGGRGNEVYAIRDLTAQRRTEALLEHKKQLEQLNGRLDIALNNMARGLSMFDAQQRLIVCNKIYREIYDLPESLTQPGTPLAEIVRYHVKTETGRDSEEDIENQRKWIESHVAELARGKSFTHTQNLKSGRIVLVTNQPLADGGWVDLQEDVTEKRNAEQKIAWLARHDTLTKIPNRFHFREQLENACRGLGPREGFALHWIDLDHFKEVNDTLGHPVGDALLKSVAQRLRKTARKRDLVGRLGGDEFAVIQSGVVRKDQANRMAKRILRALGQAHQVLGHNITVGASIGTVLAPEHGLNADVILKNADLALYDAKASGRSCHAVFAAERDYKIKERHETEADLKVAVKEGQLALHYQPIVDIRTYEVTSFEALMRWHHPTRGMIPPVDFIPVAERTGLIVEMGTWALQQACRDAACWPVHIKVTVNLSAVQFEGGDLHQVVCEALERSGLSANRLELEITESVLLRDDARTHEVLHKLNDLGVRIALDDFGTAFASLSYLRSFPFDKIKIDRSFVKDLPDREDCVAIVQAVAGLARQLDIATVAEGVETRAQLDTVSIAGCNAVQGYYFSRPVPAAEIPAVLGECRAKMDTAA